MSRTPYFGEGLPYAEADEWPGFLIAVEGCDLSGRTTQTAMLREWLELQGCGVVETDWTRDQLLSDGIVEVIGGRPTDAHALLLMQATDFADRLEKVILPSLRNGLAVLADRYVFTAFARGAAWGADPQWVRDVFGFAPVPDLVLFLQADIGTLIHRALRNGPFDGPPAGADLRPGDDPFECFRKYQARMIREFGQLADEFEFSRISARKPPEAIQKEIREVVARFLDRRQRQDAARKEPSSGQKATRSANKSKSQTTET
jgi:dTMP kinase